MPGLLSGLVRAGVAARSGYNQGQIQGNVINDQREREAQAMQLAALRQALAAYQAQQGIQHNNDVLDEQRRYHADQMTADEQQREETGRHNRMMEQQGRFTVTPAVGEDGKPVVAVVNTRNGSVVPTNVGRPQGTQGGAQGAIQETRIATAAGQARDADAIMRKIEDNYLAGHQSFGVMDFALAKSALKGSVMAETALNKTNPSLAQYVRAAKAVASAERLITPRGGSNALMLAEQMLSGAGPGSNRALIDQARGYRQRLVDGLSSHQGAPASQTSTTSSSHDVTATIDQMIQQGLSDEEIARRLSGGH